VVENSKRDQTIVSLQLNYKSIEIAESMTDLGSILDWEGFRTSTEVSAVVIQSTILAMLISIGTSIISFRAALQKKSAAMVWLGAFCATYALWNLFYLVSYTQRDISLAETTLTATAAHRGHLILGVILPLIAAKFISLIFFSRRATSRMFVASVTAVIILYYSPVEKYYFLANALTGTFILICFSSLAFGLFRVYRTTENLKLKTRSYFVLVGLAVCALFSLVGQIRAESAIPLIPLPYVGNILTAVFLYFLFQMVANPRLREIRELMLRGIRILLLTLILSSIFLSLLAWVGKEDAELFIFNTFIASFIILSVLEPLRSRMDTFFLKQFIVDRYEFEELLKKLPKRLRGAKTVPDLCEAILNGIRESGRIYQTGLFLWDQNARDYRLVEPSNLNFKTSLEVDHPLIAFFKGHPDPLLLEQDHEVPVEVQEALREMHTHMAIPLHRQDELLGIWLLRTSLRSTNPYTSFSDQEISRLNTLSADIMSVLDQLQHFEGQERQKKLAALGEMSAALAHEIRNPLGAIHGATQLLETSPSLLNSEDRECVGILRMEVDRMQKTVNQYLNFARTQEEPVSIFIDTLLRKMIQEVQPKADRTGTRLLLDVQPEIPPLMSDPLKLEQVLFNLTQNACEAFSKTVTVSASLAPQGMLISVKDDGPGMPADVLPNVFTPLFTTKRAGSGLGLPICKKIIDSLGGSISVESRLNVGTTFKILLPLAGEKAARMVN